MDDMDERSAEAHEIPQTEETPLLTSNPSSTRSIKRSRSRRKVACLALSFALVLLAAACALMALTLPKMAQSYVKDTIQLEVSSVRLLDVSDSGADVQLIGSLYLDSGRAHDGSYGPRLVNTMLSVLGPVQLSDTIAQIYLADEASEQVALAHMSPMNVKLANGMRNVFDIHTSVEMKNVEVLGRLAEKVVSNKTRVISASAVVDTTLTRFVSIRRSLVQNFSYELQGDAGSLPAFNITQLAVKDSADTGVSASAAVTVELKLPIDANVPRVKFQLSIAGCDGQPIPLATGESSPFEIRSNSSQIKLKGSGECPRVPKDALIKCPNSDERSPIDAAMQNFLSGNSTTVFVGGYSDQGEEVSWIQKILEYVSVPIEVPGSQSDQFARDIELSDVKFNLPSFIGGGGKPKISGKIKGIIDIPSDISVGIAIDSAHVLADLIYKKKKFATIESPGWAPASSKYPSSHELAVEVVLRDAPVTITNQDVFSTILSELLGGSVLVDVVGTGDVKFTTSLGGLEAHELPIEARDVEIAGFGFLGGLRPKITEIGVLSTTPDSLELVAIAEVENPTSYEAYASYFDALLTYENRTLGNITVEDTHIVAGKNRIRARLRYAPELFDHGGLNAECGSRMLGRYLSERPVNVTLKAHRHSIPEYPNFSDALAYLPMQFNLPVPRLIPPPSDGDGDGDGDGEDATNPGGSQFLVSARFHLLSSTASFVLRNPLNETITVTNLHAKATYHDDVVGVLDYGYPITLSGTDPETETTRIPVSWKLPPSDILRKALGGTLRVNATANATVSVGSMNAIPVTIELREVGAGVGL